MARILTFASALLLFSCASGPTVPSGAGGAWGYVRLVPREGVSATPAAGAYGDRRLSDARRVDYSRPGFVVVYAEGASEPAGTVEVVIREGVAGARLEPTFAAVGMGGTIRLRNETPTRHVVSAREHRRLEAIDPGGTLEFPATVAGEHGFSLLSAPSSDGRVFVAPGAFAVVSDSGRYELLGIEPGPRRLVAWHPRFPSAARWVDLSSSEATRTDIEIGVDRPREVGP